MRTNESKKRIRSLVLLIAFTTVLLIMSVYAWFSTQSNVSISNLKGKIEVAEGLQLSIDAENWAQSIEFGTTHTGIGSQISNGIVADWDEFDLGIQTSASPYQHNGMNYVTNNIRPVMNPVTYSRGSSATDSTTGYLSPITTAGALTSDMKSIKFFRGAYSGVKLGQIFQAPEEVDTGIYAFDIYLMNNTKGDKADQLYLNYDSIVREIKSSLEGEDYGLKNCVRVGFAFYSGVTDSSSSKDQVLEATYNSPISQIAIWEPNYDTHSVYVMKQNEKLRDLAGNIANNATAIDTVYLEDYPVDLQIANVYTTDSSLIGLNTYNAIRTKGEIVTAEIEENEVSANASGIQRIKDVDGKDVKLIANKIYKMRVYVWIDGQDPDCINWASHSDGIDVNIGLVKAGAGKQFEGDNLNQVTEDIDQETYAWTQYRDEVNKIPYVTNGNVTLEVGTAVTGYSAGGKGDGNWYILGAENGQLLITTKEKVTTLQLGQSGNFTECQNDYVTGVSQLNTAVSSYKNASLADNIRSINVEDINRVTGYNPEATGDGTGGRDQEGYLWEYGHQVTYRKDSSTGKIWYKGTKNNLTDTESTETSFTYYTGTEWKTLSNGEKVTITSNAYMYYPDSLGTSRGGTVNGISTANERPAYKVLFKENGTVTNACYWLGSPYVYASEGTADFGILSVCGGYVIYGDFCYSNGGAYDSSHGVRPAVSLKSNIPVDSSGHIGS